MEGQIEWGTVIAVIGTLAGGIVAHVLQNQSEKRREERKTGRELIAKRIENFENTVELMIERIGYDRYSKGVLPEMAIETRLLDIDMEVKKIYLSALSFANLSKPKELLGMFNTIEADYWALIQPPEGIKEVDKEEKRLEIEKLEEFYTKIVKILDDVRKKGV